MTCPEALDQMARFLVAAPCPRSVARCRSPSSSRSRTRCVAIVDYLPSTDVGREVAARLASGDVEQDLNRRVVLHGDYWPGNVLWQDGRLVAVIDWEDASLGDPLADLATARVELLCRYGDDAMERFTHPLPRHCTGTRSDRCGSTRCRCGSCTCRQLRWPRWATGVWNRARKLGAGHGRSGSSIVQPGSSAEPIRRDRRSADSRCFLGAESNRLEVERVKVAMRWWCMPPPMTWLVTLSHPP